MLLVFFLPATVVATVAAQALLQDPEASALNPAAWGFILVAALLWPLTLPSMLRKKWAKWQAVGSVESSEYKLS
jgi:predicted permease